MPDPFTLRATDNYLIYAEYSPAQSTLRAAVHLVHGMGEHQGRYIHVRDALNQAGYAVLAHDHRGHGKTAELNGDPLGHMTAAGATMETWVSDMGVARQALIDQVRQGIPLILLGHSMGSFFSQRTVQSHQDWYDGLILSGSNGRANFKQRLATYIPRLEALLRGRNKPAEFFHELTFREFNRSFKADGHRQAWLSRDSKIWAAYTADPHCGFVVHAGSYIELGRMIQMNFESANMAQLNRNMPTLMFGGTRDALTEMGIGLQKLYDEWQSLGFEDISLKFWHDCRHECLNELNKLDVLAHTIDWLKARF